LSAVALAKEEKEAVLWRISHRGNVSLASLA